jgi:hypothetical protein
MRLRVFIRHWAIIRGLNLTAPINSKRAAKWLNRPEIEIPPSSQSPGLILFGILVGAVFAELGLRVIGFSYPRFITSSCWLRCGQHRGWYQRRRASYVRINSDGQRDRDHEKKSPNTYRVAIVGDSYSSNARGHGPYILEDYRKSLPGGTLSKQVEVINFGVSDTAPLKYLMLEQFGYSPDLILLAVTANNDVLENSCAEKANDVPLHLAAAIWRWTALSERQRPSGRQSLRAVSPVGFRIDRG